MNTKRMTLNNTKMASWYNSYLKSNCYSVKNFYGRCSYEKINIEESIKARLHDDNLIGYKILNGNSFFFTVGYMSSDRKKFYVETSCNIFECELD